VEPATDWCWSQLADPTAASGYLLKYALIFLDAHPDDPRSPATVDSFRGLVDDDGCLRVPGGTEDEKLTPLDLSPEPGTLSRRLFDEERIERDLTRVAEDQQDDGGWTFDWLEWCPAQGLDWRGIRTVQAVATLAAHHVAVTKGGT